MLESKKEMPNLTRMTWIVWNGFFLLSWNGNWIFEFPLQSSKFCTAKKAGILTKCSCASMCTERLYPPSMPRARSSSIPRGVLPCPIVSPAISRKSRSRRSKSSSTSTISTTTTTTSTRGRSACPYCFTGHPLSSGHCCLPRPKFESDLARPDSHISSSAGMTSQH